MTGEELALGLMANARRIEASRVLSQRQAISLALGTDARPLAETMRAAGIGDEQIVSVVAQMQQAVMKAGRR